MKINGDKKSFSKTSSNMQHAALVNTLDAIWGTSKGVRQLCSKKRKEVLCKKRRLNRSCLDSEFFFYFLSAQTNKKVAIFVKNFDPLWRLLLLLYVCMYLTGTFPSARNKPSVLLQSPNNSHRHQMDCFHKIQTKNFLVFQGKCIGFIFCPFSLYSLLFVV